MARRTDAAADVATTVTGSRLPALAIDA